MGAVYSNTLARINSGRLLTDEKYKRLADAEYSAALKMLADYGYGGGEAGDVDAVIARETDELIAFIEENGVNRYASRALLCRFLYANAKTLYKSRFVPVDFASALYTVGEDLTGIASGDYAALDDTMRDALEVLDASESADSRPRYIDAVLTRARFADELHCARKSHSRVLVKYVVSEIDLNNILAMFRVNALGWKAEALSELFIPGGTVDEETLTDCVGAELSKIASDLGHTPYAPIVDSLCEKGYEYLSGFETGSDDYLYMLTDAGVTSLDKFDVFLRYVLAKLTELKMVKMILTCIKGGVREEIPKRMRCLDA